MSTYLDRARELRAATDRHYSCSQSALIPFAESVGMDTEDAYRVAAAFGGGMRTANLCGAFTGGLMALGLLGMDDRATVVEFTRRMKANHDGTLLCAELLAANARAGKEKKPHCDGMVFEAVALVEELLKERQGQE